MTAWYRVRERTMTAWTEYKMVLVGSLGLLPHKRSPHAPRTGDHHHLHCRLHYCFDGAGDSDPCALQSFLAPHSLLWERCSDVRARYERPLWLFFFLIIMCKMCQERASGPLELEFQCVVRHQDGWRELNSGPLWEYGCLTTEPSFRPQKLWFLIFSSMNTTLFDPAHHTTWHLLTSPEPHSTGRLKYWNCWICFHLIFIKSLGRRYCCL